MKNILTLVSLSILLILSACGGNEELNGQTPSDIPIEWANAMIQRDDSKRINLLEEPSTALDPFKGPENDEELQNYELIEWKSSDDKYYYQIKFIDPVTDDNRTEVMEINRTDEGWKRSQFSNLKNFESLVSGIDSEVLRELHEDE